MIRVSHHTLLEFDVVSDQFLSSLVFALGCVDDRPRVAPFQANSRAVTNVDTEGFVKVCRPRLTGPGAKSTRGRVLLLRHLQRMIVDLSAMKQFLSFFFESFS